MDRLDLFDLIPAMPQQQRQQIFWAYEMARHWHNGQSRDLGGEVFEEHLCGTVRIGLSYGYTHYEQIILFLLHDILEDTDMLISLLEQVFGWELAREILSVSKTYGIEDPRSGEINRSVKLPKERYFAIVKRNGIRTIIAKLCDRKQNQGSLIATPPEGSIWTPEKRLAQVAETREWFYPLAEIADKRFLVDLEEQCMAIEADANRLLTKRRPKRRKAT